MTPEAKVKQKIKKLLTAMGVWYFLPVAGIYAKKGIPDFICCANGRFLAIEAKANGGQATALQLNTIAEINKHAGIAIIIDEANFHTLERQVANIIAGTLYAQDRCRCVEYMTCEVCLAR